MLPNSYFLEKEAQVRHREMVASACQEQLIKAIEAQKPKLGTTLLKWAGNWLIILLSRTENV